MTAGGDPGCSAVTVMAIEIMRLCQVLDGIRRDGLALRGDLVGRNIVPPRRRARRPKTGPSQEGRAEVEKASGSLGKEPEKGKEKEKEPESSEESSEETEGTEETEEEEDEDAEGSEESEEQEESEESEEEKMEVDPSPTTHAD